MGRGRVRFDGIGGFVCANFCAMRACVRPVGVAEVLELEEIAESAGVCAFEAGFDAMEERVGVRVGEALESAGEGGDGG